MSWTGIVHEVLTGNANRTYLPPDVLLLEHFQILDNTPHRNRYLAGLSLDCYLNQENDRNSHYLAREFMWSGRPKSAIREFDRHIAMNRWAQERGQSLIFRGDCYLSLGNEEEALASWHRAITADGTRREPWLRLADYFWKKNDPQKVVSYVSAALEVPFNDCYCNQQSHYRDIPHQLMYWALWWLGDRERSKEHWQKALAYDPTNPKYIQDKQYYESDPNAYIQPTPEIEGWMTPFELNWLHQQAKKVDSILELGSWKGRSTHALLSGCKGKVTCVDTWKGSADPRDSTNVMAKQADVLVEFKNNVGHFPNLEIVQMDSAYAAAKFAAEGRKFDMVFIDAGHTYEEVKRDIELWRHKAKVILSGHDYLPQTWMGVCQAVDELCGKTYKAESIWYTPAVPMPRIQGLYPESLAEFQDKIEANTPFSFVKCGDGELACMNGEQGGTCDGQPYSFELNTALRRVFAFLMSHSSYLAAWEDRADADGRLLLHRTDTQNMAALRSFYGTVRNSPNRKVFIGPAKLSGAAKMLRAEHLTVPDKDAFSGYNELWDRLKGMLVERGIYLFSAGPTAKVLIADALRACPSITCLDTGSSFDPIFLSQTRTFQAPQGELRELYADFLEPKIPKSVFTVWLSDGPELPSNIEKCVASQRAVPGYEHKVITLADLPKGIPYLDAAIAAKRWVKASDYLRIHELVERGGIHLDADVEVLPGRNFDDLLSASLFVGREENGFISTAVIGAIPNHPLLKEHLEEVVRKFKGDDDKNFESSLELITPRIYTAATTDNSIQICSPEYFYPYNHQTGCINVTGNTRVFHHFLKSWTKGKESGDLLPTVAILIPTLGRPEGLQRCLDSIDQLYYPKHLVRVVVDHDEGTVPQKVNRMATANQDVDAFLYAANDVEFNDPWCLYRAVKEAQGNPPDPHPFEVPPTTPFLYGLVSFNTGPVYSDEGNISEHFLITKALWDELGEIFSEKFHHCGCDNLLWAKAQKLKQAYHSETAKITHHHFTKGAPRDDVYSIGWSQVEQDRAILVEELKKLEAI